MAAYFSMQCFDSSSPKKKMTEEEKRRKKDESDDFVAVDIAALSLLATIEDSAASPRQLKNPSRKGSQRATTAAGEKKAAEAEAEAARVSTGEREKHLLGIHVGADGEGCTVPHGTTPTGRCRRTASRRAAPWLGPRGVFFFFATLSCMGTLVLLYFTLFMGKMGSNATDAGWYPP